jgi:hypothetical protein
MLFSFFFGSSGSAQREDADREGNVSFHPEALHHQVLQEKSMTIPKEFRNNSHFQ